MRTRLLACLGMLMLIACSSASPLGDGTFEGSLPSGWHDVALSEGHRASGVVLMIHDDTVPLPVEIVVRRLELPGELEGNDWAPITDLTIPAPRTRVGDEWQDNTRQVHRFRKRFDTGEAFEADVQVEAGEGAGQRFLRGLRLAPRR